MIAKLPLLAAPGSFRARAIAAVCARIARLPAESGAPELDELLRREEALGSRRPDPNEALGELEGPLGLSAPELLAVALADAVESDMLLGRAVARLQDPAGGSRPTLGLLAALFDASPAEEALAAIVCGPAVASGLIVVGDESAPLAERAAAVPMPVHLALGGRDGAFPSTTIGVPEGRRVPLPASTLEEIDRLARGLASARGRALALRCVAPLEGRTVASAIAHALGKRAAFVSGDPAPGFGVWLRLRRLLPVFVIDAAPGERRSITPPLGYEGPLLTLSARDVLVEVAGERPPTFAPDVPDVGERARLWKDALGPAPFVEELSRHHRVRAGRIAQLGRLARQGAASRGAATPDIGDVHRAAWAAEGPGIGDSVTEPVEDDALVAGEGLRRDLELLLLRCRSRDTLADDLGPAARAKYRTGVRALLVGPSGTGKTLAASWLATRLGVPMYRVDLAAVTSKYIGDTEKNLAAMFERAEESEIIILFDEADALFAKRTDVRDAHDRFANAQTNYLLQRIESFDGIALLTSNSRQRIDAAFMRRLDAVVEFNAPGAEERRRLWDAHLGARHALAQRDVNRLAALAELSGGQIRNAVLCAAAIARADGRAVAYADVAQGLAGEYRKEGRQMPGELRAERARE